ncbi:MAG: alpha-hydroxy acid oxidase [Robiginitalea sp.]|jgi:L-lactate dehydrogenase (cytochrome)
MRNATNIQFDPRYPSVKDLRNKARRRIPGFAFDYLDGGCNEEVNLRRNRDDLQAIQLLPRYLDPFDGAKLNTGLFGQQYKAPFGVAPIGLQGLIWPGSPQILARTAVAQGLPFILSTVGTASLEEISELTEGRAWFQFYHPASDRIRDDLLDRAEAAGVRVLVLLCDTPTFGFRPREIRRGLAMPPKMTPGNVLQMLSRPRWAHKTLQHGVPRFANLLPYMPDHMNLRKLGTFMDVFFEKRMTHAKIAYIRNRWKGTLVLKGVSTPADAETALKLGLDGIIVSNHGGRQHDAGPSSIQALREINRLLGGKLPLMMDSGVQSGTDIARAMACGASAVFLGRAFMYGVAALGSRGGDHVAGMLEAQLRQVMEQIGCQHPEDLPSFI